MRLFFFLIFCTSEALAFCIDPSPPFSKPAKPITPYCINEFSNTHTCDDYAINSYRNEIDSYNYDVKRYVRELQSYVDDANDYANCEIRRLNNQ